VKPDIDARSYLS